MSIPEVNADFPDENAQKALTDVQDLKTEMPFLINITNDEKRHLAKVSTGSVGWLEEVQSYIGTNPTFVPPYLDVAKLTSQIGLTKKLSPIAEGLDQVNSMLDSTFAVVGSEAYQGALSFYHSVGDAMKRNVPGAKAIYEELSKRFPGHPKGSSPNTNQTPPQK